MNAQLPRNGQQFKARLLRAVRAQTQRELGEAVGWEATKTSRVLSGETPAFLDEILDFVAASGLALIEAPDGATVTISEARYRALITLSGERMDDLKAGG